MIKSLATFVVVALFSFNTSFVLAAKPVKKVEKKGKDVLQGITFSYFFSQAAVPASDVVWFACRNIVNNRYLVNQDRTKICWIKNPAEFGEILKGLGIKYEREKTIAGSVCPPSFQSPEYCDPAKLRSF